VFPQLNEHLRGGNISAAFDLASRGGGQMLAVRTTGRGGARSMSDAWSESSVPLSKRMGSAGYARQGRLSPSQVGGVQVETLHPNEPILVVPVLAHWTFTCTQAGDFQSRMQQLHVGLHGTLMPLAAAPLGKTLPPPTRPAATVLATGHVQLDAI